MRKNLKISAALLSLVLAGNTFVLTSAHGEIFRKTNTINKEVGNVPYDEYIVQEGDTYLDIARKIIEHYKKNEGEKYFNVNEELLSQLLVKMNIDLFMLEPNDIVYFPDTSLDSNNMILSMNGEKGEVSVGNLGSKDERIALNTLSLLNLLREIYGKNGYIDRRFGEHIDNIDIAFAQKYLEQLGLSDKYYLSGDDNAIILNSDNVTGAYYDLTESIYLPSEMNNRIPLKKTEVIKLLQEIYGKDGYMDERFGESVEHVDEHFAESYIEQLGLGDKYYLSDSDEAIVVGGDNEAYYDLTESLPLPSEVETRIPLSGDSVLDLLDEIYGENGYMDERFDEHVDTVDLDFAQKYLEQLGLGDKYYLSDSDDAVIIGGDNDAYYDLTESLLLPSEMDENQPKTR